MHREGYGKVKPKFYVINFDDPSAATGAIPIHPDFMTDIADAYESSYTIMMNLNRTWVQKQGDFFVESPIVLVRRNNLVSQRFTRTVYIAHFPMQ